MDLAAALDVLGVAPGTPLADVRTAYRRAVAAAHPDRAEDRSDPRAGHDETAALTVAWATVQAAGTTDLPAAPPDPRADTSDPPGAAPTAGDTIGIAAPPDEAFVLLLDAAAEVGTIAYVDRNLGILETIVRFEGGPSCSVLITLQGRAWGTEAFCTMESIEATPAPPIDAVVAALVDALTR